MIQLWPIRIYKEGDERGTLELMKLSGIELTSEQWFWEYKNNPFGHLIGVAEFNGQIGRAHPSFSFEEGPTELVNWYTKNRHLRVSHRLG